MYIVKVPVVVPIGRDWLCLRGVMLLGNLTDHFLSGAVKAVQVPLGDGSGVPLAGVAVSSAVGSSVAGASVTSAVAVAVAVALALATAIVDAEGLAFDALLGIMTKRPPAAASRSTPPIARSIGRLDFPTGWAAGWATHGAGAGGGAPQAGCCWAESNPQLPHWV
jgi:hypothetical protein